MRIEPALGDLQFAEGVMAHEQGLIEVQLERAGEEGIRARITLPEGLTGSFAWEGRESALRGGTQEITY